MLLLPSYFKNSQKGTVFLEIVISIGILAVLLNGIASLVIASYEILGFSRTRVTARHLANEKMELIRNLPYLQVGVSGGIPPGNILQLEKIMRNGLEYWVRSNVVYIDDPFDGLLPNDTLATDYKRVRVDVSWTGIFESKSTVTLVSDFSQKGVENTGEGGTLSVLVFDSQAQPVPDAQVRIQNTSVVPLIDLTVNTDSNGLVILPGSPSCFECYRIDVSKDGFSSDRTYSSVEIEHPDKPFATISEQSTTEVSFAIDKVSSLIVASVQGRASSYAPLANQFFQLRGNKIIGTDIEEAFVYKYDQLLQTNSSGVITINDIEWDLYTLMVPAGSWDFAGSNPFTPFALLPNSLLNISFVSEPHQDNSFLFKVMEASGSAISQAIIHLTTNSGYDEAKTTGEVDMADFGQAYFNALSAGNYNVEATKSGYLTSAFETTASGTLEETIILNRP